MKKLLLIVCIVFLFFSCNNEPVENNVNDNNNTNNNGGAPNNEKTELKEPILVSNVSHTKDGNTYTVYFEHDGVDVLKFNIYIGCTNGVVSQQHINLMNLDKSTREITFVNDWECFHTSCDYLVVIIDVIYDFLKYDLIKYKTHYIYDFLK